MLPRDDPQPSGVSAYLMGDLAPAVLLVAAYAVGVTLAPHRVLVLNVALYAAMFAYYQWRHPLRWREFLDSIAGRRAFWIPVLVTAVGLGLALVAGVALPLLFPQAPDGMIKLPIHSPGQVALFVLSTICLPPFAEELCFRRALLRPVAGMPIGVLAVISVLLFAAEHALAPLGIAVAAIWALPFTIAYLKTRNVYVVVVAHLVADLVGNVPNVVVALGRLS